MSQFGGSLGLHKLCSNKVSCCTSVKLPVLRQVSELVILRWSLVITISLDGVAQQEQAQMAVVGGLDSDSALDKEKMSNDNGKERNYVAEAHNWEARVKGELESARVSTSFFGWHPFFDRH